MKYKYTILNLFFNHAATGGDGEGEQGPDGGAVSVVPGPKNVVTLLNTRDSTFRIATETLLKSGLLHHHLFLI